MTLPFTKPVSAVFASDMVPFKVKKVGKNNLGFGGKEFYDSKVGKRRKFLLNLSEIGNARVGAEF